MPIMWLEAILTCEDLEDVVHHLAPFTLTMGGHGSVRLDAPTAVTIVEGRGLRITCAGVVHGSVLGIDLPVTIRSSTVLLEPSIGSRGGRDVVLFQAKVEMIDLVAVPHVVENVAVDAINAALAKHDAELCWDFRATLSHRFALPDRLTAAPTLDVSATWGELRITADALVLAVSFRGTPKRGPSSIPAATHEQDGENGQAKERSC